MNILIVGEPEIKEDSFDALFPDAEFAFVEDSQAALQKANQTHFDLVIINNPENFFSHHNINVNLKTFQELEISHRTIKALMQAPTFGMLLIKADGEIILANPLFAKAIGLENINLAGKNFFELLPPELAEHRRSAFKRAIETRQPQQFEGRGIIGVVEIRIFPIPDESGEICQLVIFSQDITKRKNVEEEMVMSYRMIQALLDNPADLACVIDLDGKIRLINPTLASIYKSSPENLIGRNLWDLSSPKSTFFRKDVLEQIRRTRQSMRVEDIGPHGNFDSIVRPIMNEDGEVIQLAVLARDITERIKAERDLRERELLLSAVVNNVNVMLVAMNLDGVVTFAEGAGFSSHDYYPATLIGKHLSEIHEVPADILEKTNQALRGQESTGKLTTMNGLTYETHHIPLRDSNGDLSGAIALSLNVSEYLKAQEELHNSRNELQAILDSIDDSISVTSVNNEMMFVNSSGLRMMGFQSEEELLQRFPDPNSIQFFSEIGLPIKWEVLVDELQSGTYFSPAVIRMLPYGSKEEKWLKTRAIPIQDDHGKLQYYITVSTDITEIKQAQNQLEASRDELERKISERTAELNQANQELIEHVAQSQRAAAQAESLARIATVISEQTELSDILNTICEEMVRSIQFSFCSISLYDEETDSLNITNFYPDVELQSPLPAIPRELFDHISRIYGPIIVIPDIDVLPGNPLSDFFVPFGIRTVIVNPIMDHDKLLGNLNVASIGEERIPDPSEMNFIKTMAERAKIGITKARLFEQVSESRKRLQVLSNKLVEIQEQERRTLARELHDEIGQSLTSLRLNLDFITRSLSDCHGLSEGLHKDLQQHLQSASSTTVQLLDRVRKISLDLRPTMLDDLGLLPALFVLFDGFSSQTKIQIQFKHSGVERRFRSNIETAAFRIVQEAITNVAKHAETMSVSVRLWADHSFLRLQVEDDGIGFNPNKTFQLKQTSGLSGMNERAAACGGILEIESEPGHGVRISAEFPLNNGKSDETDYLISR